MSLKQMENGQNIGFTAKSLFDLASVESAIIPDGELAKPIILRLSIGSNEWQICQKIVTEIPTMSPTQVARVLMKVGYLGYLRSKGANNV